MTRVLLGIILAAAVGWTFWWFVSMQTPDATTDNAVPISTN